VARSVKCPQCGHALTVGDDAVGKQLTCAGCKKTFTVQAAHATAVAKASPDAAAMAKAPGTKVAPKTAGPAAPPKAGAAAPKAPGPAAPPPVPSAGRPWHLHVDGRTVGPYAAAAVVDQVKTGKIPTETLAWKEGMADWQPLSEVPDFHGPLGTAIRHQKSTTVHEHGHGRSHDRDRDKEERHRFVPGSSARAERMLAVYGLVGVVVVGLIVALVFAFKSKNEPAHTTPRPLGGPSGGEPQILYGGTIIKTSTATPAEKPSPGPRGQFSNLDNKAYFDKFRADLTKSFEDAIAAHKQAKAAPIRSLAKACKNAADELGRRQWSPSNVKMEVESLTAQLKQASDVITEALKDREFRWRASDGIEGPARSTVLELDKTAWLENWQKLLLKDFAGRVEKAGI